MKIKSSFIALALLALSTLNSQLSTARAQGTAFTYQGRLQNNGGPVSGTYYLTFTVFNINLGGVPVAGPVTNNAIVVTNGLFTVPIDFGAGVFTGGSNWLEISVRTNGAGTFSTLTPRQQLTATPYAITAENVVGLTVQQNTNGSPNVIEGSSVNYVSNSVYGATIAGGGAANFSNSVIADFGTVSGGGGNTASGWASTVGGGAGNTASSPDGSATVGGGYNNTASGDSATVGGGAFNIASGYYATVGGGYINVAKGDYATVGGGGYNFIGTNSNSGTVSGGFANQIADNTHDSAIGGGSYGSIGSNSFASTLAGGSHNSIGSNASVAAIGGGTNNTASGIGATVAGGANNTAAGSFSFAAGQQAQALYAGDFVWADSQNAEFDSSGTNEFAVRANGGVRFVTGGAGMALDGQAVVPSGNYVFAYNSGVQSVATGNVFQDVNFGTDAQLDGWMHSVGASEYTNAQTGLYLIQFNANVATTSGNGTNAQLQATLNGVEIPGSRVVVTFSGLNQFSAVSKSLIASANVGDVLTVQFTGSGTGIRLTGSANSTLTITRIQ